MKGSKWI